MSRPFSRALPVLLLVSFLLIGCGSDRVLESVSVSPATARAQDYPNGVVVFTASGTFSASPAHVNPITVKWAAPNQPLTPCPPNCGVGASIGVSCSGIMAGQTFTIDATAPRDPSVETGSEGVPTVKGTAQLICP